MRSLIIRAAMFAAYCLVIAVTVAFGFAGYRYGALALVALNVPVTSTTLLAARIGGAVVGALAGFVVASFAAAVLFLLREIARNTAEIRETQSFTTPQPASPPRRPVERRGPTWQ